MALGLLTLCSQLSTPWLVKSLHSFQSCTLICGWPMWWLCLSCILLLSIIFTLVHFQYKYLLLLSLLFTFMPLPSFSSGCLVHSIFSLTGTPTPAYKQLKSNTPELNIVQTTCLLSLDTTPMIISAQKSTVKDWMPLNGQRVFFITLPSSNLRPPTNALESKI